jgi:hypothetical protein
MLLANYLHKEHNNRINNFFHDMDIFHWLKILNFFLGFVVLIGALFSQCENLAGGLRLTYENASFSQAPYSLPVKMAASTKGLKIQLKNANLTNEMTNLNHENVKDEELTLMSQMAR